MHGADDGRVGPGSVAEGAGVQLEMSLGHAVHQSGGEPESVEELMHAADRLVQRLRLQGRDLLICPPLASSLGPSSPGIRVFGQGGGKDLGQLPVSLDSGRLGDHGVELARPPRAPCPLRGAPNKTGSLQCLEVEAGGGHVQADRGRQLSDVERLRGGLQHLE